MAKRKSKKYHPGKKKQNISIPLSSSVPYDVWFFSDPVKNFEKGVEVAREIMADLQPKIDSGQPLNNLEMIDKIMAESVLNDWAQRESIKAELQLEGLRRTAGSGLN